MYYKIYPRITIGFGWIIYLLIYIAVYSFCLCRETKKGSYIRFWNKNNKYYSIYLRGIFRARILAYKLKKKGWINKNNLYIVKWFRKEKTYYDKQIEEGFVSGKTLKNCYLISYPKYKER